MASIHKHISINADPDRVWAAVRDFGAVHRLVPDFVVDCRLEDGARIVTFANGNVARELLVDCDEARRRLVYAIVSERMTHYGASVQVFDDGPFDDGAMRCRVTWVVDVLPNEIAPYISSQMDLGVWAMQRAFDAATRPA